MKSVNVSLANHNNHHHNTNTYHQTCIRNIRDLSITIPTHSRGARSNVQTSSVTFLYGRENSEVFYDFAKGWSGPLMLSDTHTDMETHQTGGPYCMTIPNVSIVDYVCNPFDASREVMLTNPPWNWIWLALCKLSRNSHMNLRVKIFYPIGYHTLTLLIQYVQRRCMSIPNTVLWLHFSWVIIIEITLRKLYQSVYFLSGPLPCGGLILDGAMQKLTDQISNIWSLIGYK